jgi:hypothetical protein
MFVVATGHRGGRADRHPALHIGALEVGLSLPVGVLLGGLVCGWLRSVRPRWFGPHSRPDAVDLRIDRPDGLRRGRRA